MPQTPDRSAAAALRAIMARCKRAYGDPDLAAFGFRNTLQNPFIWSVEEDVELIIGKIEHAPEPAHAGAEAALVLP